MKLYLKTWRAEAAVSPFVGATLFRGKSCFNAGNWYALIWLGKLFLCLSHNAG
jgi:hypothetical protein